MTFTAYERRFVAQTPRAQIAPRAFDRARAMRTFDRVSKRFYPPIDWADAGIPPVISREEATFWLYAIAGIDASRRALQEMRGFPKVAVAVDHDEARAHARAELERLDVAQPPSRAAIARRLAAVARATWGGGSYREIVIALAALLDLPSLLETILDEANADTAFAVLRERGPGDGVAERAWLTHSLAAGFADSVAPYLDDASFEQARTVVRPALRRALARGPFTGDDHHRTEAFPAACYLAAALHLTDDVEAIVAWWSGDIATAKTLAFLPAIVYGLRTPGTVVAESRRVGIALAEPAAIREWLATTGDAGLDYAHEQLAAHAAEPGADAFVDAVAALDTAAVPAAILRLTAIPALYVSARTWLEANVDRALAALASANDGTSALRTTANEILRRFARREHPGAIAALAAKGRT